MQVKYKIYMDKNTVGTVFSLREALLENEARADKSPEYLDMIVFSEGCKQQKIKVRNAIASYRSAHESYVLQNHPAAKMLLKEDVVNKMLTVQMEFSAYRRISRQSRLMQREFKTA